MTPGGDCITLSVKCVADGGFLGSAVILLSHFDHLVSCMVVLLSPFIVSLHGCVVAAFHCFPVWLCCCRLSLFSCVVDFDSRIT